MKKIFFLLLLLPFLASAQKTTPGNYNYIAQKYEWDAGVFKGLGTPSGSGPAAFIAGQVQRAGAQYWDSAGGDAGFYMYNGVAWILQGSPSSINERDEVLDGGEVVYSGSGFTLNVRPAIFRINNIIYTSDSSTFTLSASDGGLNRLDKTYFDVTGFHVLEGTPGIPALEPHVEGGQIPWVLISVPAGSTTPGITTTIIYDENTESVITNTGTSTDGDNTTNVFRLTKSLQFGPLTNGDIIWIDPALPTLAWDINGKDFSLFIKLGSVLSTGYNLYVQFFNGATAVSPEVAIGINKSFLFYQPVKIPFSSFGNITNTNITRVRIRFQGAGTLAVSYMDYVHFVTGLTQPGPAGGVNSVTLQGPTGWAFNGPTTGDVIQTIVPGGTSTQILGGDGVVKTDSSVHVVDPIDSYTKNDDGATINTATKSIGFHLVNSTFNGLMSSLQYRQLDTLLNQTLENASTGDTLVYAIDAFRTAIKSIVAGSNITITPTDTTLVIASTGGGGSGIGEVVSDYGLQNINDSTIAVDTFLIATKDRVLEVADSLAAALAANLLFDSLGTAGISPMTVKDDTLMARRISISGGSIDTTASGGLLITVTGGTGVDDSAYHRITQLNDSTILFHSNEAVDTVVIRGGAVAGSGGSGAIGQPYLITLTSGTTWTTPADITTATRFKITMTGGGGGGAGMNTSNDKAGSGGAAGALVVYVTDLSPSTGYTMAIGAAGVGGDATGTNGTAGTATTLTIGATTYTANGGGAGLTDDGGAGGTATNGDLNITGQDGDDSGVTASTATFGGRGGSPGFGLGIGGAAQRNQGGGAGSGRPGTGYGSGGSGGVSTTATGGDGGPGIIIIEYFK